MSADDIPDGHHDMAKDTPERTENAKVWAEMIRPEMDLNSEKVILDFGCGTGIVGLNFLGSVKKIIFQDVSQRSLEQCKKNLNETGQKNFEIFHGEINQYTGEKVDYIIASMVYHHIQDINGVTKELFARLNPKGKLIICDFNANDIIFQKTRPNVPYFGLDPTDLCKMFTDCGFKSTEIKPANPLTLEIDGSKVTGQRYTIIAEAP
ncbi:S-adenosylmethionine-dependent methyltransferase [Tritrichomonas foetus]|uniref:S-adenosylmethionine-dependent methyltransferase n=1 Tax=Tritrichomonas foetus TaxID=1144522 RepID=A0A1J4KXP7_9EUKA|nr:S-adenosylmethionine-dependent methyltransferase [Tritrichomonas foetus]|eukprot:OHT14333.1 S-adenosylmethionine-dependent methyltransferase [Tritrichomonas foetus]